MVESFELDDLVEVSEVKDRVFDGLGVVADLVEAVRRGGAATWPVRELTVRAKKN